jgi:hypothetical protein
MDHELVAVTRNENDDLEQVDGAIWADDQPSIGFLARSSKTRSVRDGVGDVVVVDTVAPSRSMDLHTLISYYEIQQGRAWQGEMSRPELGIFAVAMTIAADQLPPSRQLVKDGGTNE